MKSSQADLPPKKDKCINPFTTELLFVPVIQRYRDQESNQGYTHLILNTLSQVEVIFLKQFRPLIQEPHESDMSEPVPSMHAGVNELHTDKV